MGEELFWCEDLWIWMMPCESKESANNERSLTEEAVPEISTLGLKENASEQGSREAVGIPL